MSFDWIDWIDVVSGAVLALIGNGFISKFMLQRDRAAQDRKLQQLKTDLEGGMRRLQTHLDRTQLVHRTHFETEFRVLKDVWAKASKVRASMGPVRPSGDVVERDESPSQREEREFNNFKAFNDHVNDLVTAVDSQSPFIHETIFQKAEQVLEVAQRELMDVRLHRHNREDGRVPNWFERGRVNFDDLKARVSELSDLIRVRLASLAVLPGE